jgi:hypothetical protein
MPARASRKLAVGMRLNSAQIPALVRQSAANADVSGEIPVH